jgi:hypothetical protein
MPPVLFYLWEYIERGFCWLSSAFKTWRIPRKWADIGILLAGVSLAFSLQYLSPSFRFFFNNMLFRETGFCGRIRYICGQFSVAPNRMAIEVVIVATVIVVIVIYFLISKRHDKDDDIITMLKQIRDKDVVNPSVGGGNATTTKDEKRNQQSQQVEKGQKNRKA